MEDARQFLYRLKSVEYPCLENEKQKQDAIKSMKKVQKKYKDRISTSIETAPEFYEAEAYHQKYLMKKGAKTCL